MTVQRQLMFWSFVTAAFVVLLFLFRPVLVPFVLGAVIAYLLDPVILRMTRLGIGRGAAALVILAAFLAVVAGVLFLVAPFAWHQLSDLMDNLPTYAEKFHLLMDQYKSRIEFFLSPEEYEQAAQFAQKNGDAVSAVAGNIFSGAARGWNGVYTLLSVFFITPVIAYFMMKEWPRIKTSVSALFPRRHAEAIEGLLKKIDVKISGFVRGQLIVAFILGVSYATALGVAGLKYGFLIGLLSGLFSIIPLVGSTIGLVVGLLVAWFQSGDWPFVVVVAGIFVAGQLIEGNILTPKLVGDRVGLHPLWIFFALMAGGSLLGLAGMLIAVPVAAAASVLIVFGVEQYKASLYYKGAGHG